MAMLEAGVRKVADKLTLCEDDSDDDSDSEADPQTTSREATVINFLLVQPKSLQGMCIFNYLCYIVVNCSSGIFGIRFTTYSDVQGLNDCDTFV